jgi:16S rRNA (guanine966-N2)-methyltransferase
MDRAAIEAIRSNAATLGAQRAEIRQSSALSPPPADQPFDLILIDPPYGSVDYAALLDQLTTQGWASDETIIALETARDTDVLPQSLTKLAERDVGKARLHLFQR